MSLENKRIGAVVRAIRIERKMSQAKLAKRLKLQQSAMSRIESGEQALTAIEGFKVCQILGIPTHQLFMNLKVKS